MATPGGVISSDARFEGQLAKLTALLITLIAHSVEVSAASKKGVDGFVAPLCRLAAAIAKQCGEKASRNAATSLSRAWKAGKFSIAGLSLVENVKLTDAAASQEQRDPATEVRGSLPPPPRPLPCQAPCRTRF